MQCAAFNIHFKDEIIEFKEEHQHHNLKIKRNAESKRGKKNRGRKMKSRRKMKNGRKIKSGRKMKNEQKPKYERNMNGETRKKDKRREKNRKQNKKGSKPTRKMIKQKESIAFVGENCNFVDFGSVGGLGTDCVDGTKMVLKNKYKQYRASSESSLELRETETLYCRKHFSCYWTLRCAIL